jgi:hypothetical protein
VVEVALQVTVFPSNGNIGMLGEGLGGGGDGGGGLGGCGGLGIEIAWILRNTDCSSPGTLFHDGEVTSSV